jgi:hypothetical protein
MVFTDVTLAMRHSFVGMLFALVIANSSKNISNVLYILTDGWTGFLDLTVAYSNDFAVLTSLSHETLVIVLVTLSWFGWSKSLIGTQEKIVDDKSLTSFYILPLLEIILVILYFSLSESNDFNNGEMYLGNVDNIKSSSKPEVLIIMCIYIVYVIWDYFSDVWSKPLPVEIGRVRRILSYTVTAPIVFCFSSIASGLFVFILYCISPNDSNGVQIILTDFSLFLIILFFHKSKCLEGYWISVFKVEEGRLGGGGRKALPTKREVFSVVLILFLYLVLSIIILKIGCIR